MKKLILCAVAASMTLVSHAQLTAGTDVLSVQSLTEAGLTVPSESEQTFVSPTTGTPYIISSISDYNDKLYFNSSLGVRNTESRGYLEEVSILDPTVNTSGTTGFTIYVANEPISSFMQPGVKTLKIDKETSTAFADEPYTYVAIWCYQASASALEIKWSDEAPVPEVERPYIILNSERGCPSGTTVTIASDTEVAKIEVKMSKGDVTLLEQTLDNPCELTLDGAIGEKISIEARAVAEGIEPSSWIKRTYTITQPILMDPELSLYAYTNAVTLGEQVRITNPNIDGSILNYSVCGAEPVSTTESEVTLTVEGTIGEAWSVSAWCVMDGYGASMVAEWTGVINTNVCPAPVFSIEPGEYAYGTEIGITASYPARTITYRVNGGEWTTTSDLRGIGVSLTSELTIEAYTSAPAPYVDSETATGVFTVEKLDGDIDVITGAMFGETEMGSMETYLSDPTANGAVYSFTGYEFYGGGMYVNGSGSIATYTSSRPIKRIKIEAAFDNQISVYLSDERIKAPSKYLTCVTVIDGEYESGEWFEVKAGEDEPPYTHFYITTTESSMANVIDRILVEYAGETRVTEMDTDEYATVYYDLTGRRVMNPAPGLLIRVVDGKATKVMVR